MKKKKSQTAPRTSVVNKAEEKSKLALLLAFGVFLVGLFMMARANGIM